MGKNDMTPPGQANDQKGVLIIRRIHFMKTVVTFIKKPGMICLMALIAIWLIISVAFGANLLVDLILVSAIIAYSWYLKKFYYQNSNIKYFLYGIILTFALIVAISVLIFVMNHFIYIIIVVIIVVGILKKI